MAPETEIPEVCKDAMLPRRIVRLFQIKENSQNMFFTRKGVSNECFKTYKMIQRTVVLPK